MDFLCACPDNICWLVHSFSHILFVIIFIYLHIFSFISLFAGLLINDYNIFFIIFLVCSFINLFIFVGLFSHSSIHFVCLFTQSSIHFVCSFLLLVCLFLHLFTETPSAPRFTQGRLGHFPSTQHNILQYQFFTQGYAFPMNPVMYSTC